MFFIKTIDAKNAQGKLKQIYRRVAGSDGKIDHILISHSLRPHTLEGHMHLYKNVLHHKANTLPKSQLEALGVYVSMLNQCSYCIEHHFEGYKKLINDNGRAQIVRQAMEQQALAEIFSKNELTLFNYAEKLTLKPASVIAEDIKKMRDAGFDDGEILEVNQVVAYFNYANRTVLGLGVSLEKSGLGLSPNDHDDEENWGHS